MPIHHNEVGVSIMRSKRAPDRVHVVRPPAQDEYVSSRNQNTEIVRMLAQISDKLKRSEAERYELLNELREYRKSLRELEDKTEHSEKAYLSLETKIKTKGSLDTESTRRQLKFERVLKATEDKLTKAIAGQAVIDQRLSDAEDKQTAMDQRLDQSVAEQARISRQHELVAQDKSRLVRKVERLEELVSETQDSLRAKAMVLLTDQSSGAQKVALQAPAWGTGSPQTQTKESPKIQGWRALLTKQNVSMAALIVAALVTGWAINQAQQPKLPSFDQPLPEMAEKTQSTSGTEIEVPSDRIVHLEDIASLEKEVSMQSGAAKETTTQDVLNYSDEQLLAALNKDPEQLASQLNDIEPSKPAPVEKPKEAEEMTSSIPENRALTLQFSGEPIMPNFDQVAFKQDPSVSAAIKAERKVQTTISKDEGLTGTIKNIETAAFQGNAEAQHDLAALYTAGQGVEQNFDRASFWFEESANAGIANSRYNLGVLYHQGLGKKRDLTRALYWYREAAKLNHGEAQYNLGIAHIEGIGTDYDPRLAAAFFEKAANNGVMEAAYNLGLIFENGLLGETKPEEALLWYKIAADQGSPDAKQALEALAKNLQIGLGDVDNMVERMQQINESVTGRRAGPKSTHNKNSSVNNRQAIVAQIQEYLMLTGIHPGPADGVYGPVTAQAIRTYQAANSLPVDGQPSQSLLNAMVGGGAIKKISVSQ